MIPLLLVAQLFQPFKIHTPLGFRIIHNGVCCTAAVVDQVYLQTAVHWKERGGEAWASEFAPYTTEIFYLPMVLQHWFCDRAVQYGVVKNGPVDGYTIVINLVAENPRKDLPAVLRAAYWRLFLVMTGQSPSWQWAERSCLN